MAAEPEETGGEDVPNPIPANEDPEASAYQVGDLISTKVKYETEDKEDADRWVSAVITSLHDPKTTCDLVVINARNYQVVPLADQVPLGDVLPMSELENAIAVLKAHKGENYFWKKCKEIVTGEDFYVNLLTDKVTLDRPANYHESVNLDLDKDLDAEAGQKEIDEIMKYDIEGAVSKAGLALQVQQMLDQAEKASELLEVANLDAVNESSIAKLGDLLGNMFAAKKQHAKDEGEEEKELNEVSAMDKVNEESKNNLSSMLGGMFATKLKQLEEADELQKVAAMDGVNKESKANISSMLADKFNLVKQSVMDNSEQNAELENVEKMDKVNEESKNDMANMLAGKFSAMKQFYIDNKEQAVELKAIKKLDKVNTSSETFEALADLFFEDCENPDGLRRGQFAKLYSKNKKRCDEVFGQPLAFSDFAKADENHDKLMSKKEFVNWLRAQDKQLEGIETSLATQLADKFAAIKQHNMDEKEEAEGLQALVTMNLVNEKTKKFMENKLARMFAAKNRHNVDEAEETKELTQIAAMDKVNNVVKGVLNAKLMNMFLRTTLEKEEQAELDQVKTLDKVNENSVNAMENMLANKFKQDKAMTRIMKQHVKDEDEEQVELKEVAAMDNVNTVKASAMENMLASKFKQDKAMTRIMKHQAKDEAEEQVELKEVAAMDNVNTVKANEMENMLKQKFKQDKAMTRILKQQSESEIEEKEESEEVAKMDLTENERTLVDEYFNLFDANHDGKIDVREMENTLKDHLDGGRVEAFLNTFDKSYENNFVSKTQVMDYFAETKSRIKGDEVKMETILTNMIRNPTLIEENEPKSDEIVEEKEEAKPVAEPAAEKRMENKVVAEIQGDIDAEEEAVELKEVAAMDAVNEESKAKMENLLANKMAAQKQHAKDEAEEEKELKEVAAMDVVNEESKEVLAAQLEKKKEKEAEKTEEAAAEN